MYFTMERGEVRSTYMYISTVTTWSEIEQNLRWKRIYSPTSDCPEKCKDAATKLKILKVI